MNSQQVLIPQRAVLKVPNGHVAYVVNATNKVERCDLVVGEWIKDDWVMDKAAALTFGRNE